MNTIRIVVGLLLCAVPSGMQASVQRVMDAANASFADMPTLQVVDRISQNCGADATVNPIVAYCASTNRVFIAAAALDLPDAPYRLAHVLGHAAQIRHGVADVALATIRANRDEEQTLRTHVTRQVECLAGVYIARAGLGPARLTDWFKEEPFRGAHWGRNPLTVGPRVSIGFAERDRWFQRGQSGKVADCAVPVFGADLLIAVDRY